MKTRFNINFKVKDAKPCSICNPIEPCYKSHICEDCLIWLKQK